MNGPNSYIKTHWVLPSIVVIICGGIALWGDAGRVMLAYQNDFTCSRQLWRGVSGHFTHLGWPHLLLNIFGLCGVWSLYGKTFSSLVWSFIFLITCLAISMGLYLFDSTLQSYVGLSGVLHGLLAAGALGSLFQSIKCINSWPIEDIFVFTAVWLKVTYENILGPVPMTESISGGNVITSAHLYGAIIGTVMGCMITALMLTNNKAQKTKNSL